MRVLQSGLAERYQDAGSDGDGDDAEVEGSARWKRPAAGGSVNSSEGSPSRYNLRQRTPRKLESTFVYANPRHQDINQGLPIKVEPDESSSCSRRSSDCIKQHNATTSPDESPARPLSTPTLAL
jgi:hypothetical protein